jgi:chromatin segregation and condensation protein Rec8/ScpA/Scc1 (kleisin family)
VAYGDAATTPSRLEQVFKGPMDLLLHLVREQEVDIHEIDLHRVIEGYLRYLKDLRRSTSSSRAISSSWRRR